MSTPQDLLGRIARARADMMMRQGGPLILKLGPATAREFARESEIADIDDWSATVWNMPIRITPTMEGFAVCLSDA